MIIGQSVTQNGVVMALVSVVISLYVIGLQRIRVQTRPSAPHGPVHDPLSHPGSGSVDGEPPTAASLAPR
ncbi:MAG: hypothetical protein NTX54_01630 [Chloroflexi bacterium]|nr:hypothetical protein [Chloroflexota bacterium]